MERTPQMLDQGEITSHDVNGLGYEQARDALIEVVRRLEAGGVPLEESLALWERGEALAGRCQSWLDGARERLEAVRAAGAAGAPPQPGDHDESVVTGAR